MIFVALDLETTGLSPETDTIIEVAAIRFEIVRDGEKFAMGNHEEHSQLVHPGRLLTQEVTMITGITADMLVGKPDFGSVRDKIRDFIGDAVLVGHNVFFDIAMFATHGIDLSQNKVIDTFELSEIFSQNVESLNLGFLANRYNLIDPAEAEHRALTDTKLSIRLLLRYLGEIGELQGMRRQIWDILSTQDESHTLGILSQICHETLVYSKNPNELFSSFLREKPVDRESKETDYRGIYHKDMQSLILLDTHANITEELNIIQEAFQTHTHIELMVPEYKSAIWMSQYLTQNNIENMISITYDRWCSVEYMRELLMSSTVFPRKKMILILKIAFWLLNTKTGLLEEMKFYGDERNMIDMFRCRNDESHIWREQYEQKIKNIPLLITHTYHQQSNDHSRYTIIKDIPLLEDTIRRKNSYEISFDKLYTTIESLMTHSENIESRIHMTDMISMIRGIYESVPDRPTGPLASPPGTYGETYFMTQSMLWHRGHKWLVHATRRLEISWDQWNQNIIGVISREQKINIEYIDRCIRFLIRYHSIQDTNTNMILNIYDEKTKITFISRSIQKIIKPLLDGSLGYGVNIFSPETRGFLLREYGIDDTSFRASHNDLSKPPPSRIIQGEYHAGIIKSGTVILTTSQKHARDIGQELRRIHGKNMEVLIQGLSGGKGKMLSLFNENREKAILVGIVDTWRDEYNLWKSAKNIVIAKLPFDPPTDPYFMTRTVGMSNNFAEYSEPILIIRLNTLIERILQSGYSGSIICSDDRLANTEWGKRIFSELL